MAATDFTAAFTSVAITSTPKTVISLIAPTNIGVYLKEIGIGFSGTSGTYEPILVELIRAASDGTGTSVTPLKTGLSSATIQSTSKHTYTAEPGTITVLKQWKIHPQSQLILPQNASIILPAGSISGLRVTTANNMNCWGYLACEE